LKHSTPLALLIVVSATFSCYAQTSLALESSRLPNKKIEKLLEKQNINTYSDLNLVQSSCYSADDSLDFYTHYMRFEFDASAQEVWNAYTQVKPAKAWNCKIARFGFLYSKESGELTYSGDDFEGLREGQVFYINLKFMGVINLAVGSEVKRINPKQKTIRFCYLESGRSRGSQWIKLTETDSGKTLVEHYTRYKSDSPFRDSKLYPWLHGKIISSFHQNVKQLVESSASRTLQAQGN